MNIVFLDIDGVLVSWLNMKSDRDWFGVPFQDYSIDALNQITKLIDGKIVITSTWRKTRDIETFNKAFIERGIEAEVIGFTMESDNGRASEIQNWIDSNDVDYFIAIDDDTRGLEEHFKESMNVLRTGLYRGLDHYDFLYAKRSFEIYNSGTRKKH